jgi:hypothetical protein
VVGVQGIQNTAVLAEIDLIHRWEKIMRKLYSARAVVGLCLSPVSFTAVHAAEQTEAVEANGNTAAPAQP